MLIFPCQVCNTQLSAEETQAGSLVRCPTCLSTLRVPVAQRSQQLVGAGAGVAGPGTALPPRPDFGSLLSVASLVLGIIGIPAFCTVVTPLLAIVFGVIGYNQANKADVQAGGKGMAIAGIVCGIIGCIIGALTFLR